MAGNTLTKTDSLQERLFENLHRYIEKSHEFDTKGVFKQIKRLSDNSFLNGDQKTKLIRHFIEIQGIIPS